MQHISLHNHLVLQGSVSRRAQEASSTHSSVTFFGIPLGRDFRCLLLQRTTVSRHVHSWGHCGRGKQLVSSWPAKGHPVGVGKQMGRGRDMDYENPIVEIILDLSKEIDLDLRLPRQPYKVS